MTAPTPAVVTPERLTELEQLRASYEQHRTAWTAAITAGGDINSHGSLFASYDEAAEAFDGVLWTAGPDLIAEVRRLTAVVQRVEAVMRALDDSCEAGARNLVDASTVSRAVRAALAGES